MYVSEFLIHFAQEKIKVKWVKWEKNFLRNFFVDLSKIIGAKINGIKEYFIIADSGMFFLNVYFCIIDNMPKSWSLKILCIFKLHLKLDTFLIVSWWSKKLFVIFGVTYKELKMVKDPNLFTIFKLGWPCTYIIIMEVTNILHILILNDVKS